MKTTVEITDGLFETVKRRTAERGITFRQAVESGLHRWLEDAERQEGFKLKDGSVKGAGMVKDLTFQEMLELSYRDRI